MSSLESFPIFLFQPRQSSPQTLERTALVRSEPKSAEGILRHNHQQAYESRVGYTEEITEEAEETVSEDIEAAAEDETGESAEDEASECRLQQIVGKAHPAEDAEMLQRAANAAKRVPRRNNSRCYHKQNKQIVDWGEPHIQSAKVGKAQSRHRRADENDVPDVQVTTFVVEKPLSPKLHSKHEKA